MKLILKLVANTLAVFVTAYIIPGVDVDTFLTAGIVAIVLGVLNTFIKPLLVILTLPINILTLGLFTLIINAFIIGLTSYLISGFMVGSILSAILFSIVLSFVSAFLNSFVD
jgi:putative membrane protein